MGEDKTIAKVSECMKYGGMNLLTDLAVMMQNDALALVFGLREFVTAVYGPVMSHEFPDLQVKTFRNSELCVNLVSVVDCSVLIWAEQQELRRMSSDGTPFRRIAQPDWMVMDFNNSFKCHIGGEEPYHVHSNPKLWNLQLIVNDSGEAKLVPTWPKAYVHVKEDQQAWLAGSRNMLDQSPRYPLIKRKSQGFTAPVIAPSIKAAREVEEGMRKWIEGLESARIS